jgi:L-serine deaminase
MFVTDDEQKLAILGSAIACRPAALRIKAKDREAVKWLARAGLLIDAGDGTVAPTEAAIHFDELASA